jgi:lysyl-tRNA synthetase class II
MACGQAFISKITIDFKHSIHTADNQSFKIEFIQYQGDEFDFSKAFERMSVFDSILQYNPDLCAEDLNAESASTTATKLGIKVKESWGKSIRNKGVVIIATR